VRPATAEAARDHSIGELRLNRLAGSGRRSDGAAAARAGGRSPKLPAAVSPVPQIRVGGAPIKFRDTF